MIDDTSLHILKILQEKARIPNVEVARQVGLAPSAVLERIKKMEKQGLIDGYEVRLNPEQFKRNLVAFIFVDMTDRNDLPEAEKCLSGLTDIQELHFITGEDCYLLKVRVRDTSDLEKLIREKISRIGKGCKTRTLISLKTVKETSRIPLEDYCSKT
ncbi:MAG: Lrp/AsnC family transcriptional regulator [Proteobacteria bacterium]|nr:Lrp/AsnC family transcriptional regulator [Pseudomonadota bacterium]